MCRCGPLLPEHGPYRSGHAGLCPAQRITAMRRFGAATSHTTAQRPRPPAANALGLGLRAGVACLCCCKVDQSDAYVNRPHFGRVQVVQAVQAAQGHSLLSDRVIAPVWRTQAWHPAGPRPIRSCACAGSANFDEPRGAYEPIEFCFNADPGLGFATATGLGAKPSAGSLFSTSTT